MSETKTAAPKFNDAQKKQLELAKELGIRDTECRKHPEWGPNLMNFCIFREKENQETKPVFLTAAWLSDNFQKTDGVLFDDLDVLSYTFDKFKHAGTPMAPIFREDGSFDKEMYLFKITENRLLVNGAHYLASGRVSFCDEMGFLDDIRLIGEGIPEAVRIAQALQSFAADEKEDGIMRTTDDPFMEMNNRALRMTSILLALDDMNIRGYQLPLALKYADSSMEALYGLVRTSRPKQLCGYLNKRSAERFLAGDESCCQVAVPSGASFTRKDPADMQCPEYAALKLKMDETDAETFAALDVTPLAVDYAALDIKSDISIKEAMRICGARGFKLVREVGKPGKFGDSLTSLIFFHPETKDYLVIPKAKEDDVCYGGADLILHRTSDSLCPGMSFDCSNGPHDGQGGRYYEFTHHDGCFRAWDFLRHFLPDADFDWKKIGFGSYGIPLPEYFELPFIQDRDLPGLLGNTAAYCMMQMGGFYFNRVVNALLALSDNILLNGPSPHYALLEEWLMENILTDMAGWYVPEKPDSAYAASMAFTWLKLPDRMLVEIREGAAMHFAKRDAQGKEKWGSLCREHQEEDFRRYAKHLTNRHKDIGKFTKAYSLPAPESLPVVPRWLA